MDLLDSLRYIVVPLGAALLGGFIVHVGARRRDVENDRRRQRVEYLMSAYRVLARASHRDLRGDRGEAFEDALTDIVMFGTVEQIALAKQAMHDLATDRAASTDALLLALRQELRAALSLGDDRLTTVPTVRMSWGGDSSPPPLQAGESFEVRFDAGIAHTREVLPAIEEAQGSPVETREIDSLHELAKTAPGAAVAGAYGLLGHTLGSLVTDADASLDPVGLARLGAERGVVAAPSLPIVEGLRSLMELSHSGGAGTGLTVERAHDYIDLTRGMIDALKNYKGHASEYGSST